MIHILIVDDDKNICRYYSALLSRAGYTVFCSRSVKEALSIMENTRIDLILLDIMLPETDGFSFARTLRNCRNEIPILMVTARDSAADVKKGFLSGTDDYMKKPVDEDEMLLRIKGLLRRAKILTDRRLSVGSTVLDYDSLTVRVGSQANTLPQKEFYLLYKLLSYPNQIFTRIQLMEDIWEPDTTSMESTVSVHINRLRKRYENNPDFYIHTIRGLGYQACLKENRSSL